MANLLENARVALVGRASEVLECARAFKRPRIQNDHVFKTTTYSKRPRIQNFHRLHLRVARSLRSLANKNRREDSSFNRGVLDSKQTVSQ